MPSKALARARVAHPERFLVSWKVFGAPRVDLSIVRGKSFFTQPCREVVLEFYEMSSQADVFGGS
jgi:hypothetical protein